MPAIPPLRHARIAIILLLVFIILLLLRNNLISLHQSSNFVWSLSNHSGSETILLGSVAYIFSFAGTGATDISLSDCLYISSEALFVIFKDPNLLNNTLISFILHELILFSHGLCYMCFVLCSGGSFT